MWTVRAVQIDDLDKLETLIRSATRGLTTLQLNRAQLLDRVEQSVFAFSRSGHLPKDEPYVLVLANDQSSELVGTSTIYAKTGGHQAFYSYRLVSKEYSSKILGVSQTRRSLVMNRVHDGPTEIGSLFLRGVYRGQGRGRWLSLARFTVIAARRGRFANRVIAEMRGKAEPDGRVTFWEAVSGRFIPG
jgi:arginine N-succinyltransferase